MRVERYRRVRLCRLCEGPIVDRGVLVYQTRRMDKLRRWWKAHFDTEYVGKRCAVCYFCAWDLRFADVHYGSKEPPEQIWWPPYKSKKATKYYPYYSEELMKPCSVKITPLAPNFLEEEEARQQKGDMQMNQCIYCLKVFSKFQHLSKHTRKFHPEKEIRCNNAPCRRFFHTLEEKNEHQEKEHPSKKELLVKCFYCGMVTTKYKLGAHLYSKHRGQVIKCEFLSCNNFNTLYFKSQEEKDVHIQEKHNFGQYFCCFCDRYFEDSDTILTHMRRNHKEALKCKAVYHCPNYFKTEEDRQKHVQEKHPEAGNNRIQCIYCPNFSKRACDLISHVKKMHKCAVILKCEFKKCVTFFKSEEERQKHIGDVHGKYTFFCFYCDKTICNKGGLSKHVTTHHSEEEIIRCSYLSCVTYFKNEEEKLAHTREVHKRPDEKVCCIYCNALVSKNGWYIHGHMLRLHPGAFIKCPFNCSTYFKTEEEREEHLREEHQERKIRKKPVQCVYCDTIFANLDSFQAHVKQKHLDVAIKCNYYRCHLFFKNKEDLESHLEQKPNHRMNKSFCCPLCPGKYYRSKGTLAVHTRAHHREAQDCLHCFKDCSTLFKRGKCVFCKTCKTKFACPGILKEHKLECNRNDRCPVCGKTFEAKYLMSHCTSVHTAHVSNWRGLQFKFSGFQCDDCFLYFENRGKLNHHMKYVHTVFEGTCHFCDQQFRKRRRLMEHIEEKHLPISKKRRQ